MINETYKTLYGFESVGSIGTLGLKIEVAGSNLPDLECDASKPIRYAAMDALKKVEQEVIAIILASDPRAQERAKNERAELAQLFPQPIYVEEIPNGYCSQACCRHLPWFVVTTAVGRFQIGWRKRVILIDWSETKGTQTAEQLFPEENVTKGERDIHAWSLEDARRYILKIMLTQNPPTQPT